MENSTTEFDEFDGRPVPRSLVLADETVRNHQGSIRVMSGARLTLTGTHQGSLHVDPGAEAVIAGVHQGSLHVDHGAAVAVRGTQQGSTHVEQGGLVGVEPSGELQGSLHVHGSIRNAGVRGGSVEGDGELIDLPGARVV